MGSNLYRRVLVMQYNMYFVYTRVKRLAAPLRGAYNTYPKFTFTLVSVISGDESTLWNAALIEDSCYAYV